MVRRRFIFSIIMLIFSTLSYAQEVKIKEIFGRAQVLLLSENKRNWQNADLSMLLSSKDKIRTGRNSFLKVLFHGDTFIIKENTIIELNQIPEMASQKSILRLIRGKIRAIVNIISSRGGEVWIHTPTAVVGVYGTDFGVSSVSPKASEVYVFEGHVDVANASKPDLTVSVPEGKMTQVAAGQMPGTPMKIPPSIYNEYDVELKKTVKEPEIVPEVTPSVEEEKLPEEKKPEPEMKEPEKPLPNKEELVTKEKPKEEKKPEQQEKPEPEEPSEPWCPDPRLEFHFGLDFQYLNINNKGYGLIAFMPEFEICKIGIGLYLPVVILTPKHFLYSKRWYNHDEWDFRSPSDCGHDLVIKFLYIKYGTRGEDPFYGRIGSLPDVTFANGFIMTGYNNMENFPTVRRIGLELGFIYKRFIGVEGMVGDLSRWEIYGGRFMIFPLGLSQMGLLSRLEVGASLITDTNPAPNTKVINWGFDIGLPLVKSKMLNVRYGIDWATFSMKAPDFFGLEGWQPSNNFGFGTGFKGNLAFLIWRAEYRYLEDGYIPEYFDSFYEIQREERALALMMMYADPSPDTINGFLVQIGFSIMGAGEAGFIFQEYYNDNISNKAELYLTLKRGVIPYGYGTFSYQKLNVVGLTGSRGLFGDLYDENTILTFDGGIRIIPPFFYIKLYYQRTYERDAQGNLINHETYSTGMSIGF
ncbi:MAG: FecR domain-containing protein [Spirochaetes bacterium]|nr:FecR domain-containing protein [Spirochaetota bacterium]